MITSFDIKQKELLDSFKNIKLNQFKNINLNKVLFNASYTCLKNDSSILRLFAKFIKIIFFKTCYLNKKIGDNRLLMINYDYHRVDHSLAWKTFKDLFDGYSELNINSVSYRWFNLTKTLRSPFDCFGILKLYLNFWRALGHISSFRQRVLITFSLVNLYEIQYKLDSITFREKVAVIFFDGSPTENLIVQYLQNKGLKTVTLQHGQPVFHGKEEDRLNQSIMLNMTCDYAIIPGEFSKKQYMLSGIEESRLKVLGSLRKIEQPKIENSRCFAVFLDCITYEFAKKMNIILLEYAEKIASIIGLKFKVKLHPSDSVDNYEHIKLSNGIILDKSKSISDTLDGVSFAILHASGVYLDNLAAGVKCFCINDADVDYPLVEEELDKFSSIEELEEKVNVWRNFSIAKKKEYINKLVEYYLSPTNSSKRHVTFVYGLLNGAIEE